MKKHKHEELDVIEIRKNLGLTQEQFSEMFKIPITTLKNWEQGRSTPKNLTKVLLIALNLFPRQTLELFKLVKNDPRL